MGRARRGPGVPEGGIREGMVERGEDVLSNGAPPVPAATALTAGGGPGLAVPGGVGRGPGSFLPSLVVGWVGAAGLASFLAAFQAGVLSFLLNFSLFFFFPSQNVGGRGSLEGRCGVEALRV